MHLFSEKWLAQARLKLQIFVTFDERNAEGCWDEFIHAASCSAAASRANIRSASSSTSSSSSATSSCMLYSFVVSFSSAGGGCSRSFACLNVIAFLNLGYVLCHRSICSNAISIHQGDELWFRKISWW